MSTELHRGRTKRRRRDDDRQRKPHRGRTAVVTGAGRGLGRSAAHQLAAAGAAVVVLGRGLPALTAVVDEIRAAGGAARAMVADLSCADDIDKLASKVGQTALAAAIRPLTWRLTVWPTTLESILTRCTTARGT